MGKEKAFGNPVLCSFITWRCGMFSCSGLSKAPIERLCSEFGINGVDSGRNCVAALNIRSFDGVVAAVAKVVYVPTCAVIVEGHAMAHRCATSAKPRFAGIPVVAGRALSLGISPESGFNPPARVRCRLAKAMCGRFGHEPRPSTRFTHQPRGLVERPASA